MQEEADGESFDIRLTAGQYTYEEDVFGSNQYDKNSILGTVEEEGCTCMMIWYIDNIYYNPGMSPIMTGGNMTVGKVYKFIDDIWQVTSLSIDTNSLMSKTGLTVGYVKKYYHKDSSGNYTFCEKEHEFVYTTELGIQERNITLTGLDQSEVHLKTVFEKVTDSNNPLLEPLDITVEIDNPIANITVTNGKILLYAASEGTATVTVKNHGVVIGTCALTASYN